ncbi:uncharacterized protein NECHADRAFT_78094 [Fusarium vanettenii 77-13-4]|uniref:Uncharacterized protein n=1 Tax=Fusarium vanettenii (strain ATCC MYA-4622 / CBS 123669 / FGSC 9596 / NRRL 45880 / 77-13-4) TaxID=660122 RepID=C7YN37_FUSV7|nr:uncharacterized protein NECHADRAFT_78094 [Fusarium vanettenii 77-13-4]EEU47058.1 hypothetical protein NECHADRAFT_78094 [Fusarium vanettenii 77-13-4]
MGQEVSAASGSELRGPSPIQGLDEARSSPFTGLKDGSYLYNRSERDVFRILIDCFRLRLEEQSQHDKKGAEGTIYAGADDSLPAFRQFLELAATREDLLPPWWTPEKQRECEEFGMSGTEFQDLHMALDEPSTTLQYMDSRFPPQLRILAEAIYRNTVDGTSLFPRLLVLVQMEDEHEELERTEQVLRDHMARMNREDQLIKMGKFRSLVTSLGKRVAQKGKKDTDEDDGDSLTGDYPNESPSADDSTPLKDEEDEFVPLTRQPSRRNKHPSTEAIPSSSSSRVGVEDWYSDPKTSRSSLRLGESLPVVYEDPVKEAEPGRVEPTPSPPRRPRKQVRFSYPPAEAGPSRRPPDYTPPPPQWDERIQTNFGQSSTEAEQSSQPHPAQRLLQPRQMNFLSLNAISHEVFTTQMFKNPLLWTNQQLQAINCTMLSELASRQLPNNAAWERNITSSTVFRNPWKGVAASPLTSATRVIDQLNQGTTYACWYLIPALLRGFGLWPAAWR